MPRWRRWKSSTRITRDTSPFSKKASAPRKNTTTCSKLTWVGFRLSATVQVNGSVLGQRCILDVAQCSCISCRWGRCSLLSVEPVVYDYGWPVVYVYHIYSSSRWGRISIALISSGLLAPANWHGRMGLWILIATATIDGINNRIGLLLVCAPNCCFNLAKCKHWIDRCVMPSTPVVACSVDYLLAVPDTNCCRGHSSWPWVMIHKSFLSWL